MFRTFNVNSETEVKVTVISHIPCLTQTRVGDRPSEGIPTIQCCMIQLKLKCRKIYLYFVLI